MPLLVATTRMGDISFSKARLRKEKHSMSSMCTCRDTKWGMRASMKRDEFTALSLLRIYKEQWQVHAQCQPSSSPRSSAVRVLVKDDRPACLMIKEAAMLPEHTVVFRLEHP